MTDGGMEAGKQGVGIVAYFSVRSSDYVVFYGYGGMHTTNWKLGRSHVASVLFSRVVARL